MTAMLSTQQLEAFPSLLVTENRYYCANFVVISKTMRQTSNVCINLAQSYTAKRASDPGAIVPSKPPTAIAKLKL